MPEDIPACEEILRALPDWFGIDASIEQYVRELPELHTLVARRGEEIVGFLGAKEHNAHTVEIIVMAVRSDLHRLGVGRALVENLQRAAESQVKRLIEVKTLGPSHSDPFYARTRSFYRAMGFLPLEELQELWPGNPCLIMVKVLDG